MLRTKGYTPSYNCEYWLVSLTTQRYSPFFRGAVLRPPMPPRIREGVFNTDANDPVSAWNACPPDSKKELDAWKAHRESEMNKKKKQKGKGKRGSA
jgi:hypothetical protein